jgi:hypothetical protein
MRPTCIEWCPAARECIGSEKYERLMKRKKYPESKKEGNE